MIHVSLCVIHGAWTPKLSSLKRSLILLHQKIFLNKKGFSNRKVHIRLAKHPRFHHLLDGFYKDAEKKKFNDKTLKNYNEKTLIKDLDTNGLYARYKLCERLFKQTPLVNSRFLKSVIGS